MRAYSTPNLIIKRSRPLQTKPQALTDKEAEDRFVIKGGVVYLNTPNGLGRSRLAELIARTLRVDMTMRNWRTDLALSDAAEAL
jgi:uncharacterized protein (DUF1697 family)